jgi:hypothetical protein
MFSMAIAHAQTIPDGPVWSPPGWSCVASQGKVICVRIITVEK